jgi:predicted MFS family arabinose efflux permease
MTADSPRLSLSARIAGISHELKLFFVASFAIGMAFALVDSVLNNFLNARFTLTGFQRSFLEFPRELPGVLIIFVSAGLWFLCSRRLSALAMGLNALGILLVAYFAPSYTLVVVWLFVFSMGQHIYLPLGSTIAMELAREGQAGKRLGQLNALRNIATISGSTLVFLGFKYLGMSFEMTFTLASVGFVIGMVIYLRMKAVDVRPAGLYLTLHKEYRTYYLMAVLSGSRKQLFVTFAPWVLVTIFNQPTQTLATLMTVGGVIGVFFQPFLGRAIDRLGERPVLIAEAVLLAGVCLGYGFARQVFPGTGAFWVTIGCYLLDQMLFSVNMARSTYMKKIALDPADVQPALTLSVSIDHVFSISVALLGGVIWTAFGYQYVFLMGVVIAVLNFVVAYRLRLPRRPEASQPIVVE